MFERVLIGYDGSEQARDALALGSTLASRLGASVLLGTCMPDSRLAGGSAAGEAPNGAEEQLADALAAAQLAPGDIERHTVAGGPGADGLRDIAVAETADLIVIGSTHRGPIGRVLPGRTALRLLHDTPCPVAIAPKELVGGTAGNGDVAVAFDDTRDGRRALAVAAALASQAGAAIRLITVLEPLASDQAPRLFDRVDPIRAQEAASGRERLQLAAEEAIRDLPPELDAQSVLIEGFPTRAIPEYGLGPGDILVTGSRGRGPLATVVLGSVSDALADSSPWPLIVVPAGARVASSE
jgi:nucleotide-binding universal stress UspA family protein